MDYISSLTARETAGSIGKRYYTNNISFTAGGETAGSVGKCAPPVDTLKVQDSIQFRGYDSDNDNGSSAGSAFAAIIASGIAVAGTLAYGYKSGYIDKIKNPTAQKILTSVAKPCYTIFSSVKETAIKGYDAIKNVFKNKK